jgi:hypothetical protein
MLRLLVLVLLAVNAVMLAWNQGWLAPALLPPMAAEREPDRLARQLRADRLTVLSPKAAAQAVLAASAAEPAASTPAR